MPASQIPSSRRPKQPSIAARLIGGFFARELQQEFDQGDREQLSDQQLIIQTPPEGDPQNEMEVSSAGECWSGCGRLKDAVKALTAETISAGFESPQLT